LISHSLLAPLLVIAQTGGQTPSQGGPLAFLVQIGPIALMFVAIYFLMIRPMGKRRKEQQQLLSSLKKGDEVVTNAGIWGKIYAVEEQFISLEIADKVRMRVLKTQIANTYKEGKPFEDKPTA
jgi:preprotein translocase subunit YajC